MVVVDKQVRGVFVARSFSVNRQSVSVLFGISKNFLSSSDWILRRSGPEANQPQIARFDAEIDSGAG